MDDTEYLPISMLNQLAYCRRRFYYTYVLAEEDVNAPLLEGQMLHERAHDPGVEHDGDRVVFRRMQIWSDRLRLTGFADVVEIEDGKWVPVEYKRGRMGRWLNDHIQLCAQAICIEERTLQPIDVGEIFYWGSRRREHVPLTPELRAQTEAAVAEAFSLSVAGRIPEPLDHPAKCRDCSLEPICLPQETLSLLRGSNSAGR